MTNQPVRLLSRSEIYRIRSRGHTILGSDGEFDKSWFCRHDGRKWSKLVVYVQSPRGWIPQNGVQIPLNYSNGQALKALGDCLYAANVGNDG